MSQSCCCFTNYFNLSTVHSLGFSLAVSHWLLFLTMWVTPNKNCDPFAVAALLHVTLHFRDKVAWIKIGIRKNKYWNRLRISEFVHLEYSYWQELCVSACLANTYQFLFLSFVPLVFSWIPLFLSCKCYHTCRVKDEEKIEQVKRKNPFLSLQLARTPKQQDQAVLLCVGGITW